MRAYDPIIRNPFFQPFIGLKVRVDRAFGLGFDKFVRAVTGFARLAIHQRVGKARDVTGCHPNFWIH